MSEALARVLIDFLCVLEASADLYCTAESALDLLDAVMCHPYGSAGNSPPVIRCGGDLLGSINNVVARPCCCCWSDPRQRTGAGERKAVYARYRFFAPFLCCKAPN